MRRVVSAVALTLAALLLLAPAASARRALVAFVPTEPAPKMPLLFDLEQRDFAFGLTSPSIGAYSKRQMVLDMSQGSRIPNRAYPDPIGGLDLVYGGDGARIEGWFYDNERAKAAPGEIVPGLFAQTLVRAGRSVAYSGVIGFEQLEAAVAADEAGNVARVSLGTVGTFAARTEALLSRYDVVVARFPPDEAGLEALDKIVSQRRPDDLIYVVRAPPPGSTKLLPTGMLGPGFSGDVLFSPTTRRVGLVAATDMPTTVLAYLGVAIPTQMQGRVIETRAGGSAETVRVRLSRLDVILDRRPAALRAWGLTLVGVLLLSWVARRRDGVRWTLRVALLAALWLPGVALFTAAITPSRTAEILILVLGSFALGMLTDRLVPWPIAPALPAAIVLGAHAIDLARGSPWLGASLVGSNPKGGARFFGLGNEAEIMLSMETLLGLGAGLELVRRRRLVPWLFALGCLVMAGIMGSGRLGADVGAVITLGAGAAGAVLASYARRPSRRAILIACLAPVAGVLGLIGLDLATGGDAHLTRTVVHGHEGAGGFLQIVERRSVLSLGGLQNKAVAVICIIGVIALVWALWKRRRLLAPLAEHRAFAAGMWGGLAATIVGALGNDSGPVIFAGGFMLLALATGYVRGGQGGRGAGGQEAAAPPSALVAGT
jgi:hypothetical protein